MFINKKQALIRGIIILGILVLVNIIFKSIYFRLDFTADKRFTLSEATKSLLKDLKEPVTVTAYFSEELPPEIDKLKEDFEDLLEEYESYSNHMVVFNFVNPNEDEQIEQSVNRKGIYPLQLQSGSKDKFELQKIYLGAVVQQGESSEIIPAIEPSAPMEYALTFAIKKTSAVEKPSIALIQGQNEARKDQLTQAINYLSILYNVETYKLDTLPIPAKYQTIAIINPQDSFSTTHFKLLDDFLKRGGNMFVALSLAKANMQQGIATTNQTMLNKWLEGKDIVIKQNLVYDYDCREVIMQQRQGDQVYSVPIQFPYLPNFKNFGAHPVSKGLEIVLLPFASEISYINMDTNIKVTRLITSSNKSGTTNIPTYLMQQWKEQDFARANIPVAIALEGVISEKGLPSKMIVVSNGDFALNDKQGRIQGSADNINFLANAMDWLADESGLVELRTKTVTSRPLEEIEESKKMMIKYSNVFAPIVLIILIGLIRFQVQKQKRKSWQTDKI